MQIYKHPKRKDWLEIVQRPAFDSSALEKKVKKILKNVKDLGDKAVIKYTKKFDGVKISETLVTEEEIKLASTGISDDLKKAIRDAKKNISMFHAVQVDYPRLIETMPGVECWRKSVPIEKVGIYIPGGTAPLFSTILMLGIPAKLAGCKEIVLCSPPDKDGKLHPAILYTAQLVGATKIFKVGGVQAIAALAFGTKTIPAVNKIFGPGNQYTTCAKQLVQQNGIAIDMPAGPSEVAMFADDTADPCFIAADLLSQAEHGVDSQVILVVSHELLVMRVKKEIEIQLKKLSRKEIIKKVLKNSKIIIVKDENEAIDLLNEYAPEHLILACQHADHLSEQVVNAGSVFLGNYSPESIGDYASGTNHVLPTNGYARAYSGVSVDSFVKKITYQKLSKQGLRNIGAIVEIMAEAEGLDAHKNAVTIRLKKS
ncbi:MAG: histidinol dehydrogenase [Bacteroidota bacterium]|nr:histidinol dehydrogenase [Bacteroidota bacterium]